MPIESTEVKLQRQTVNATVQDKFSEIDASGIIAFTNTDYYITVSMENDPKLHDVEVTKEPYHNIGKMKTRNLILLNSLTNQIHTKEKKSS